MKTQAEENRAIRRLRLLTDVTCQTLCNPKISLGETLHLIYHARKQALTMFPEKAGTFDMIYGRRFLRILEEKGAFFRSSYPFWN